MDFTSKSKNILSPAYATLSATREAPRCMKGEEHGTVRRSANMHWLSTVRQFRFAYRLKIHRGSSLLNHLNHLAAQWIVCNIFMNALSLQLP